MKFFFRTSVLAFTLTFFHFPGLGQKPTTAIGLNDYLVGITDSLFIAGEQWGSAFAKASENKNYSSLVSIRFKLEIFIDRKRIDVITLKDINGSEELRLAMLDLLSFEARMVRESFIPFEKFNSKTTDAEIDKAKAYLNERVKEEGLYLKEVNYTQRVYAKKNGFTIEPE